MEISVALTRQMELHTSVRHPPRDPPQLVTLRETMHRFASLFPKLDSLATRLHTDSGTVFQTLLLIGLGGGGPANFDRQHQDGAVPMHQAKVIAREAATELEPRLRAAVPDDAELLASVNLCRQLRATLRVKVEDGNDLLTATKNVSEAVEYLDFVHTTAHGDPEQMFALYMVEDETSLRNMLAGKANGVPPLDAGSLPVSHDSTEEPECADAPTTTKAIVTQLQELCPAAASPKTPAARRIQAARTLTHWVRQGIAPQLWSRPADATELCTRLLDLAAPAVDALLAEKRSTLCMIGCELLEALLARLTCSSDLLTAEMTEPTTGRGTVGASLERWAQTLAKRTFVTVAAISRPTDLTSRVLIYRTRGHPGVARSFCAALDSGAQAELRRKCLGYLTLCVALDSALDLKERSTACGKLRVKLGMAAAKYMETGDVHVRRMARALRIVLECCHYADDGALLPITNARARRSVEEETPPIHECFGDAKGSTLAGVRRLELLLFGDQCVWSDLEGDRNTETDSVDVEMIEAAGSEASISVIEVTPTTTAEEERSLSKGPVLAAIAVNVGDSARAQSSPAKTRRRYENSAPLHVSDYDEPVAKIESARDGTPAVLSLSDTARSAPQRSSTSEPKLCASLRRKIAESRERQQENRVSSAY